MLIARVWRYHHGRVRPTNALVAAGWKQNLLSVDVRFLRHLGH
jgi:hypothetical protein